MTLAALKPFMPEALIHLELDAMWRACNAGHQQDG